MRYLFLKITIFKNNFPQHDHDFLIKEALIGLAYIVFSELIEMNIYNILLILENYYLQRHLNKMIKYIVDHERYCRYMVKRIKSK